MTEPLRQAVVVILSVVTAIVASGCAHGRSAPPAPDSPSGAVRAWHRALEDRSLERVAGLYAEDAVLMPPSSPPLRGRDAAQQLYRGQFDAFRSSFRLDLAEVVETAEWAFARGSLEARATGTASGESFTTTMSFVMVLRPGSGGEWRISRHIWNLQEPSPSELPPHP